MVKAFKFDTYFTIEHRSFIYIARFTEFIEFIFLGEKIVLVNFVAS